MQAFVDIKGYPNPSFITGDEQRPDFAIVKSDNLLLLELTVGFETNIKKNFDREAKRYQQLLAKLSNKYKVYYVNLSLGAIGIIGKDSLIMTAMGNFDLSKETCSFIMNRTINICIKTTYRNVSWDYLGIVVFIGKMTKREAEGIATLQSSDNIRHHNKI